MKQRLVILGAGQMGRAAEALLDWNAFCLCAFGDNFSGAWDPAARPPVLPVKEALSAAPDLVLLGAKRSVGAAGPLAGLPRRVPAPEGPLSLF